MSNQTTHLLLIEENTGDAALIRFMLEQVHTMPFTVEYHKRLTSGLKYLAEHTVDIVLLDMDLLDKKGLEAFHSLYSQEPDLPIILLTRFNDETVALEAIRQGAQDYLVKGQVNSEILERAIHYAIERKHAQMALATRLRYEEGIATCSRALLTHADPDVALQQALEALRFATKSAWVGIFTRRTYKDKIDGADLLHEACAAHIPPVKANFKDARDIGLEEHYASLSSGQSVCGLIHNMPGSICAGLYENDLRSMLMLPIFMGKFWYGVVIFADTCSTRAWGNEDVRLLHTAMDMVSAFLQIQRDAERRAVLLREVNHRVKNNLAAIVGFLYAELSHTAASERTRLQELITRVQGLATVHNLLSASEWAPLPLTELTKQVINSALDMVPPDRRVTFQVTPSSTKVSPTLAHHLALIINELATNVIKHALRPSEVGRIDVQITEQENIVRIEFHDNGPGYPEALLRLEKYNVGFDLIHRIVQQNLQGKLTLLNNHGAVTVIEFSPEREKSQ
ncbi:MAG: response regulator [Anaerolineae bacterium]|nr:response regulator [Anaerolineae bacterium]